MKLIGYLFFCVSVYLLAADEDRSDQIRIYVKPGTWSYRQDLPNAFSPLKLDPILKLKKGYQGEGMTSPSKGITSLTLKEVKETWLEHLEKECIDKFSMSEELLNFLKANPEIRESLLLSFEPKHDDITKALKIFTDILKLDEKMMIKYFHLAIAISIVWDQEDAIHSSKMACVWGFDKDQFNVTYTPIDVWNYFTGKYSKYFLHKMDKLVWPMLVYIVDYDLNDEERNWALKNYARWKTKIGGLYQEVKYDYQKLETRRPAIGLDRPYNIMNIKKYNGICGDQSHFASRIAKTLGIPSMKVSGEGRFGGAHAWAGYLVGKRGKPSLEFTGRYNNDMYYIGHLFNPQKRNLTLDRHLAMMLDGAAESYEDYVDALVASRLSNQIIEKEPELSKDLALYATDLSPYTKDAWDSVMSHIQAKNISWEDGMDIYKTMLKKLSDHPDITLDVMMSINDAIPAEDYKTKQKLFNLTAPLYKKMKRPDLMIELRREQCKHLVEYDGLNTLKLALLTCLDNAEESTLILPLIETCVQITKDLKLESKVKPYFSKIDAKFPKKRGSSPSEAYAEFRQLISRI
jgi:hypothetical protein